MSADLHRVIKVVDWLIFKQIVASRRDLAKVMGYTESSLSQILNAKVKLSGRFLKKLANLDEEISEDWLLTGEGEMLKSQSRPSGLSVLRDVEQNLMDRAVPVFDVPPGGVSLSTLLANQYKPIEYLSLPSLPKCDGAVRMWNDRMYPDIQRGDLLVYKKVSDLRKGLFLGQIYLVSVNLEGEEYVLVQYIQQSEVEDSVKFVSKNERFPPQDVRLDSIKSLAMIKASIRYTAI